MLDSLISHLQSLDPENANNDKIANLISISKESKFPNSFLIQRIILNPDFPIDGFDFHPTIEIIKEFRAKQDERSSIYESKSNNLETYRARLKMIKSRVSGAEWDLIRNRVADKVLLSNEYSKELASISNDLNSYRDFLRYKKLVQDEIEIARLKACCRSMNNDYSSK